MLMDNTTDGNAHHIKSFLSRPTVVAQGDWSSSDVVNSELAFLSIPQDIFTQPVFKEKLRGFLGFRASTIIRLQINCNRFQQGRMMLTFFPGSPTTTRHNIASSSLLFRTQLPHIEFDACTDTEVSIKVPYVSDRLMYDFSLDSGFVGHVGLIVYSPLAAVAGPLSVEWTLWAHFEDVELCYATVPQGLVAQSGRKVRSRKDASAQEAESAGKGPLSSLLTRFSTASGIISKIPILSPMASTASWTTSVLASAAAAMGWCRPLGNNTTVIARVALTKLSNATGMDASHNLGVLEDNSVSNIGPLGGTNLDEMNINYVLSIPTWFNTFSWPSTAVNDTVLMEFPLGPMFFYVTSGSFYYPTPLCYLGHAFTYYRGSIKMTFKFVKTEFHSGRVQISYYPGIKSSSAFTDTRASYAHREILDLRESNEITITFPWASSTPYKPMLEAYGYVQVTVLNELRAPDTVIQSIQVLTEAHADDDFEFAEPRNPQAIPFISSTLSGNSEPNPDYTYSLQGPSFPTATVNPVKYNIGSSQVVNDGTASAEYCMGEKITSLRQLLRRPAVLWKSDPQISTWDTILVRPFMTTIQTNTTTQAPVMCDWMNYIIPMYAFYRGSVRLKLLSNYAFPMVATNFPYANATSSINQTVSVLASASSRILVPQAACTSNENFLEIQTPFYNNRHCCRVNTLSRPGVASINGVDLQGPIHVTAFKVLRSDANAEQPSSTKTMTYTLYRSTGDDFTCGLFVGTVPIAFGPPYSYYYPDKWL